MTRRYGKDPNYVIAAGGNTSYKDADVLYVKASGTTMGDITPEGFVALSRRKLAELFIKSYPKDEKAREAEVLRDALSSRLEGRRAARRWRRCCMRSSRFPSCCTCIPR